MAVCGVATIETLSPMLGRFADGHFLPRAARPLLGRLRNGGYWRQDCVKRSFNLLGAIDPSGRLRALGLLRFRDSFL